mmetsp:Transcript_10145/g.29153  ORF Transcript_10145/g.29153 Transcript_10145/m.29153 type:complete len:173 (-) Transcript_10145:286-804(-)
MVRRGGGWWRRLSWTLAAGGSSSPPGGSGGATCWRWTHSSCPTRATCWRLSLTRLARSPSPSHSELKFSSRTTGHRHTHTHRRTRSFFILSGSGEAFCNSERFPVCAGDTIVLPPGSLHGIDNGPHQKMYLLELMLPNDQFAEFVRQGEQRGLEDEDLCVLIGRGCGSVAHS